MPEVQPLLCHSVIVPEDGNPPTLISAVDIESLTKGIYSKILQIKSGWCYTFINGPRTGIFRDRNGKLIISFNGKRAVTINQTVIVGGGGGVNGADGQSAYEIWLSLGNSGTEADFISSLTGPQGAAGKSAYDLWLEAGHTGTLNDFLAWLQSGSSEPPPATESPDATMLPGPTANITDASAAIWTLRMSDRAVLRNGSTTSLSGVVQLGYFNGVVWAYMGSGWKSWSGVY